MQPDHQTFQLRNAKCLELSLLLQPIHCSLIVMNSQGEVSTFELSFFQSTNKQYVGKGHYLFIINNITISFFYNFNNT